MSTPKYPAETPTGHTQSANKAPRIQFNLSFLFLLVVFASLLAWFLGTPTLLNLALLLFSFNVVGFTGGILMNRDPIKWAAFGGVIGVAGLIVVLWCTIITGYFFHNEPQPYFENGFVIECIVIPVALFICGSCITFTSGVMIATIICVSHPYLRQCYWDHEPPRSRQTDAEHPLED